MGQWDKQGKQCIQVILTIRFIYTIHIKQTYRTNRLILPIHLISGILSNPGSLAFLSILFFLGIQFKLSNRRILVSLGYQAKHVLEGILFCPSNHTILPILFLPTCPTLLVFVYILSNYFYLLYIGVYRPVVVYLYLGRGLGRASILGHSRGIGGGVMTPSI